MVDVFSNDYVAARNRFRDAAARADAQLMSYAIDEAGELTIDVAVLGERNARRCVLVTSGVHGVEGFFGSAVQLAWLQEALRDSDLSDVRVVLVHAVNPYGFHHVRRWNEDNVDLNRNFMQQGKPYRSDNQDYARFDRFLNPQTPPPRFDMAYLQGAALLLRHGYDRLAGVIATGQYEFPRGLFFGGSEPTASHRTVASNFPEWLGEANDVVLIDFHTGLGKFGDYKMLLHPVLVSRQWAASVFGGDSVVVEGTGSGAYHARGVFAAWAMQCDAQRNLQAVVAEFGTYRPIRVLNALRNENRAHHFGDTTSARYAAAKRELLECFCPRSPRWRQTVVASGLRIIAQSLDASPNTA